MEPSNYPRVICLLPREREDDIAWALSGLRIRGCELEACGAGLVRVTLYLDESGDWDGSAVERELKALGARDIERSELASRDWLASYREATRPFPVGRSWWIDPHPESPSPPPSGMARIAVEPRMAFGTGSHESTQLVLLELEGHDLAGRSVLDVGTGSGILSLAALHRGARWVVGLDNDPQAVWVARQIAAQQQPAQNPTFVIAELEVVGRGSFDLILCNMISEHFLPLLPALRRLLKPGGSAVFSGLLETQREVVSAQLAAAGLPPVAERTLNDWLSILVRVAE